MVIEVWEFELDDLNLDKCAAHGVSLGQLYAVLANRPMIRRNRADRAAPYLMLGVDDQNCCIAIPILPTYDPVVWRAVTAWYCKRPEAAVLR